jgi:hypothetical protein
MSSISAHSVAPASTLATLHALPSAAGRVHMPQKADIQFTGHSTGDSERDLYSAPDDGTRIGDFYGLPGGLKARGDGGSLNTNMGDYWAADAQGAGGMAARMVQEQLTVTELVQPRWRGSSTLARLKTPQAR